MAQRDSAVERQTVPKIKGQGLIVSVTELQNEAEYTAPVSQDPNRAEVGPEAWDSGFRP
jgi:hypothetical protein